MATCEVIVTWRDRLLLKALACRLSGQEAHQRTQILIEAIDNARI
ncbi:MAG: hypothetical protein WCP29_18870 [Acidobacteriota bacterium]